MIRYKLFNRRKDGTIGPLFINRKARLPLGTWMEAEDHPTKGYAHRPGWHLTTSPEAPHLTEKNRVWFAVETDGETLYERPKSQGGVWVLAKNIRILYEVQK